MHKFICNKLNSHPGCNEIKKILICRRNDRKSKTRGATGISTKSLSKAWKMKLFV